MNCPRTGCHRRIGPDQFACIWHWRSLPRPFKDRVQAHRDRTLAVPYEQLVADANTLWDSMP